MAPNGRMFWQSAAAVAAAVFVAAIAFGSPDSSHAQNLPKDPRAQKRAPAAKGPVQPLRRGPIAVGPSRFGPPQHPAVGQRALPQGARVAPNINPAAKGPARFGANQPGIRAPGNQVGSRASGNPPGSRALGNQPRAFPSRDPRLRAVNARTPQLRQVQRS